MNKQDRAIPSRLAAIAHAVMLQRGLQPDFSPAVQSELAAIDRPAEKSDPDIRDLRDLPWRHRVRSASPVARHCDGGGS